MKFIHLNRKILFGRGLASGNNYCVNTANRDAGFTLIEVMIVVLIAGLLALVAAPFTSAWIDSSKLTKAEGVLAEAVGRAKAAAQRNHLGAAQANTSAVVCVDNAQNSVVVLEAEVSGANVYAECVDVGTIIWQQDIPAGVAVTTADDVAIAGLCFDNRGLVRLDTDCNSTGNLKFAANVTIDTVQYY